MSFFFFLFPSVTKISASRVPSLFYRPPPHLSFTPSRCCWAEALSCRSNHQWVCLARFTPRCPPPPPAWAVEASFWLYMTLKAFATTTSSVTRPSPAQRRCPPRSWRCPAPPTWHSCTTRPAKTRCMRIQCVAWWSSALCEPNPRKCRAKSHRLIFIGRWNTSSLKNPPRAVFQLVRVLTQDSWSNSALALRLKMKSVLKDHIWLTQDIWASENILDKGKYI